MPAAALLRSPAPDATRARRPNLHRERFSRGRRVYLVNFRARIGTVPALDRHWRRAASAGAADAVDALHERPAS